MDNINCEKETHCKIDIRFSFKKNILKLVKICGNFQFLQASVFSCSLAQQASENNSTSAGSWFTQ